MVSKCSNQTGDVSPHPQAYPQNYYHSQSFPVQSRQVYEHQNVPLNLQGFPTFLSPQNESITTDKQYESI